MRVLDSSAFMSEKSKPKGPKKKTGKPAEAGSVMGNLPATRPTRLSRRHAEPVEVDATPPHAATPRATEPATKAGTTAAGSTAPRRRTRAKAAAKARPAAPAATIPAEAPAEQDPAPAAPEQPTSAPSPGEDLAADATPTQAPETLEEPASVRAEAPRARPRPVRSGLPTRDQAETEPRPAREPGPGRGIELVTTAIQAAGELAQIGIAFGGQLVKRTLDRLPKP